MGTDQPSREAELCGRRKISEQTGVRGALRKSEGPFVEVGKVWELKGSQQCLLHATLTLGFEMLGRTPMEMNQLW